MIHCFLVVLRILSYNDRMQYNNLVRSGRGTHPIPMKGGH